VHHTGAVGQFEIHTDRAVAVDLHTFSEEVLAHPVLLGHWDILGLDHLVVPGNFAYFRQGSAHCDLRVCKVENQNHCFQKPHQQMILLIPRYLNFLHSNFVQLLLHPSLPDPELCQLLLESCDRNPEVLSMWYLVIPLQQTFRRLLLEK